MKLSDKASYIILAILLLATYVFGIYLFALSEKIEQGSTEINVINSRSHDFKVSAYNSVVEQTDGSPCLGANGTNLCERYKNAENLCASNDFPLDTIVWIEDYGFCRVVDRMNSRYRRSIDIFMGYDIKMAREFGVKYKNVYIK